MRISNKIDKIQERYNQDFFNQSQYRINYPNKAVFEKLKKMKHNMLKILYYFIE